MTAPEDKLNARLLKILQDGTGTIELIHALRDLVGMAVQLEKRSPMKWMKTMVAANLDKLQDAIEEIEKSKP